MTAERHRGRVVRQKCHDRPELRALRAVGNSHRLRRPGRPEGAGTRPSGLVPLQGIEIWCSLVENELPAPVPPNEHAGAGGKVFIAVPLSSGRFIRLLSARMGQSPTLRNGTSWKAAGTRNRRESASSGLMRAFLMIVLLLLNLASSRRAPSASVFRSSAREKSPVRVQQSCARTGGSARAATAASSDFG